MVTSLIIPLVDVKQIATLLQIILKILILNHVLVYAHPSLIYMRKHHQCHVLILALEAYTGYIIQRV